MSVTAEDTMHLSYPPEQENIADLRKDIYIYIALAIYFSLHLAIRLLVSPGLELDEAEQMLLTQQLSLGYGSQPPLYTWLLSALFLVFGIHIFSLALLKNLLLFCTYFFTYQAARTLGHSRYAALAAMLSLLFIPQIAWESQRDLTHSVLVTTVTAATILCWVRLRRDPSIFNYVLVGLCWGAGILGKYNFGIFLLGFLIASYSIPEYRTLMMRPRILYAFVTMILTVAPHILWGLNNLPTLLASSGKFKQAAEGSYVASVLTGTGSLVVAALAFAGPLLAIYVILWYRHRRLCTHSCCDHQVTAPPNLLLRCIFFSLIICLAMILIFQVTAFRDRWMQPILFYLPLALLPAMERVLTYQRSRMVILLAGIVAGIVVAGLSLRAPLAPYTGSITRFNMPYSELVEKLRTQVTSTSLVVAQNNLLGGNLRLHYPTTRIVLPHRIGTYADHISDSLLLVYQDGFEWRQDKKINEAISILVGEHAKEVSVTSVESPFRHLPGKVMKVSSVLIKRTSP